MCRGEDQKRQVYTAKNLSLNLYLANLAYYSTRATASPLAGNGSFVTSNYHSIQIPTTLPRILSEIFSIISSLSVLDSLPSDS